MFPTETVVVQRLNQLLRIATSIATIVIAVTSVVVALHTLAFGWSSTAMGWLVTFGPSILVVFGAIALFAFGPLVSSTILVGAFTAYATRFGFDPHPLTRSSVLAFGIMCSCLTLTVAINLMAYNLFRIFELVEMLSKAHVEMVNLIGESLQEQLN